MTGQLRGGAHGGHGRAGATGRGAARGGAASGGVHERTVRFLRLGHSEASDGHPTDGARFAHDPACSPAAGARSMPLVPQRRWSFELAISDAPATLVQVPGSHKVVVLCHGFASTRNGFHFREIAKALARKHVGSLRFDFSGNGDSEGTFELGNYATEAKDVRAAVTFLQGMKLEVIGLLGDTLLFLILHYLYDSCARVAQELDQCGRVSAGHSKGAGSVLLYTSLYDDVPSVVSVAARFDMKAGLKERFAESVLDSVAREKEIELEQKRDDGTLIKWTLTKWVRGWSMV